MQHGPTGSTGWDPRALQAAGSIQQGALHPSTAPGLCSSLGRTSQYLSALPHRHSPGVAAALTPCSVTDWEREKPLKL